MTPDEKRERALGEYQALRKTWLDALDGERDNSVLRQLDVMTMNAIWFEWLIHLRRNASDVHELNQPLWNVFLSGYVVQQAIGIRRLVSYQRSGNQGSLKQVAIEMKSNVHVFSRGSVVQSYSGGLPAKRRFSVGSRIRQRSVSGSQTVPEELTLEKAHQRFDDLIGLSERQKRFDGQKIPTLIFDRLIGAINGDEIRAVVAWGDKVLAHADLDAGAKGWAGLTWEGIHRSISVLTQVRHFLCRNILGYEPRQIGGEYIGSQFQNVYRSFVPQLSDQHYSDTWINVEAKIAAWATEEAVSSFVLSN